MPLKFCLNISAYSLTFLFFSQALNYSNESIYSGRGTVTTLSLSSVSVSPRSSTLDGGFPNTLAQIPDSGISNTDEELNSYFKDFDDENILDIFQSHHPSLPLKKTQSWVDGKYLFCIDVHSEILN